MVGALEGCKSVNGLKTCSFCERSALSVYSTKNQTRADKWRMGMIVRSYLWSRTRK